VTSTGKTSLVRQAGPFVGLLEGPHGPEQPMGKELGSEQQRLPMCICLLSVRAEGAALSVCGPAEGAPGARAATEERGTMSIILSAAAAASLWWFPSDKNHWLAASSVSRQLRHGMCNVLSQPGSPQCSTQPIVGGDSKALCLYMSHICIVAVTTAIHHPISTAYCSGIQLNPAITHYCSKSIPRHRWHQRGNQGKAGKPCQACIAGSVGDAPAWQWQAVGTWVCSVYAHPRANGPTTSENGCRWPL
jgi:hypothetical protein